MNKTQQKIDECEEWMNALFSPILTENENASYRDAQIAFTNLLGYFIERLRLAKPHSDNVMGAVRIDNIALASMLTHFQRDAFGVQKFTTYAKELVKNEEISEPISDDLIKRVKSLGLRVTADDPRKTRIAATFALWMCVYRPVSFDSEKLSMIHPKSMEHFNASMNYWLCETYLCKFGSVCLSEMPDFTIRYDRIKHDFTVREVGFSSLETMFSGIFKPNPEELKVILAEVEKHNT